MRKEIWKVRCSHRMDITSTLTHLTQEGFVDGKKVSVLEMLLTILREQCINGSERDDGGLGPGFILMPPKTSFIVGDRPAVCFFDASLVGLAQNIFFEQRMVDHQP